MPDRNSFALAVFLLAFSATACGPRRVTVPAGPGTPLSDFAPALTAARAECQGVHAFQAELALSGRAAGQRMRGRVHAGLVPGALRLEGVAPFGSPVFILVADGARGTLLLPRERRVLMDAPPEDILNALVGVRLGPDDLRAVMSGCVKAGVEPASARAYGNDWIAVDIASGGTIYLRRGNGVWRLVAGRYGGLAIDYPAFTGSRPARITLRGPELDLTLGVSQVEINGELPRDRLVAVTIPPGLTTLTLDELRRAGPLGE